MLDFHPNFIIITTQMYLSLSSFAATDTFEKKKNRKD